MKDIKLNNNVEFGNTSRDILLKIDLDKEIKRAKEAEKALEVFFDGLYAHSLEISPDPETGKVIFTLKNTNGQVISEPVELDLPVEHMIVHAGLTEDFKAINFYSAYQEDPEFVCDLSKLIEDIADKFTEVNNKLNAETAERKEADTTLKQELDLETEDRRFNEEILQENITKEEKRAIAAETDIKFGPKIFNNLSDYQYEVDYNDLDYEFAKERLSNETPAGACSAVYKKLSNGDVLFARSFDWFYDKSCTFKIHVNKGLNRFESWGIAGGSTGLTTDNVKDTSSDLYRLLPFLTLDGYNENGVVCNNNVVHCYYPESTEQIKTYPAIEEREEISMLALPRYILDHAITAEQICDDIINYVSLVCPNKLRLGGYILHYLVADKDNCFLLEVDTDTNVIVKKPCNRMFNFEQRNLETNPDGYVYIPATVVKGDETTYPTKANVVDEFGSGLERWNIVNQYYNSINSEEEMWDLIYNKLCYRQAYGCKNENQKVFDGDFEEFGWYTEFTGKRADGTILTVDSPQADYDSYGVPNNAAEEFNKRDRELAGPTWHSTHTSLYNLTKKTLKVATQSHELEENIKEYDFSSYVNQNQFEEEHINRVAAEEALAQEISDKALWEKGTGENSAQLKANAPEYQSKAMNEFTVAEGIATHANGRGSHTEGENTNTIADYSHTEGSGTTTGGIASHAEGKDTVTNNFAEHAEGKFNISHADEDSPNGNGTISSIGIGEYSLTMDKKKNAVEVMKNGDQYILGIGNYNGKELENAKTVQTVINTTISDLTAETERAIDKEEEISQSLDAEINRALEEEKKIEQESKDRDTILTNNLNTEISNRENEIERVEGLISVEATAREVGDETTLSEANAYTVTFAKSIEINDSTYVITLKDGNGESLGTIDLPLESVVVSGEYDATNKQIILTLHNGVKVNIPVGDLVSGLASEDYVNRKIEDEADERSQADLELSNRIETIEDDYLVNEDKTELEDEINNKLNKSGDTMTGDLTIEDSSLKFVSHSETYPEGLEVGSLEYDTDDFQIDLHGKYAININTEENGQIILNSGSFGTTIDGTDIPKNSTLITTAGGTIDGALTINNDLTIGKAAGHYAKLGTNTGNELVLQPSNGNVYIGAYASGKEVATREWVNTNAELVTNKVSLGSSTTAEQYPNAKSVWDECSNIRAVAEGKCKTEVLAYDEQAPTQTTFVANKYITKNGTALNTWEDYASYIGQNTLANGDFNSQNNNIEPIGYLLLLGANNKLMVELIEDLPNDYKKGDIFIVSNVDVPDRWYNPVTLRFYKLETSKVDLGWSHIGTVSDPKPDFDAIYIKKSGGIMTGALSFWGAGPSASLGINNYNLVLTTDTALKLHSTEFGSSGEGIDISYNGPSVRLYNATGQRIDLEDSGITFDSHYVDYVAQLDARGYYKLPCGDGSTSSNRYTLATEESIVKGISTAKLIAQEIQVGDDGQISITPELIRLGDDSGQGGTAADLVLYQNSKIKISINSGIYDYSGKPILYRDANGNQILGNDKGWFSRETGPDTLWVKSDLKVAQGEHVHLGTRGIDEEAGGKDNNRPFYAGHVSVVEDAYDTAIINLGYLKNGFNLNKNSSIKTEDGKRFIGIGIAGNMYIGEPNNYTKDITLYDTIIPSERSEKVTLGTSINQFQNVYAANITIGDTTLTEADLKKLLKQIHTLDDDGNIITNI